MTLPTLRILGFTIDIFLTTLAANMLVPILTMPAFDRTKGIQAFIWSSVVTFVTDLGLVLPGRPECVRLRLRGVYILTVSNWVLVCIFAALPFVLQQRISYTDTFFESMPGITATGPTVFSRLDDISPGILVRRSLLHWLGGIGFTVMTVAVLPILRIGGVYLFQTESSDHSEKALPRSHIVAKYIVATYIGITLLDSLAFRGADMSLFDAVNHTMSTISTDGFSTSDQSLTKWKQPAVRWTAIVVIILGSLPFTLYTVTLRGHRKVLIRDQRVRGLLGLLLVTWLLMGTWYAVTSELLWMDAFRIVAANVTSVITTTSFTPGDYSMWEYFSIMLFFYLGFIGGCSGSTADDIKIFCFQVTYTLFKANPYQLIHPHAVLKQNYNGHRLDKGIIRSVLTFSLFLAIVVCPLALCLSPIGLDWVTALTGAASTVADVGPGMGPIIGPSGNLASLPDATKWLLAAGMLFGRLEIITMLALLTPAFWRY